MSGGDMSAAQTFRVRYPQPDDWKDDDRAWLRTLTERYGGTVSDFEFASLPGQVYVQLPDMESADAFRSALAREGRFLILPNRLPGRSPRQEFDVADEVGTTEYRAGPGTQLPRGWSRQDRYACVRSECEHPARRHTESGCAECSCDLSQAKVVSEVEAFWP
jgi:hypothetical protein